VAVAICSLIAIPMLTYTSTVMQTGRIQSDRAQAVELANGGAWVAISNEQQLYDLCSGGATTLPSSLDGVTTTCEVLDTATLRPPTEMPFHLATVWADRTLPSGLATPETYTNPNTVADVSAWLTAAEWSTTPTENTVWVPQLPVQATSDGGTRATTMLPDTMTPPYTTCDVFFPGTFTTPITLDGPTYFTSGVYYFTEPITLTDGADVVVGNGTEIGCTTDFEAISFAASVPDPLNMSGLGGTFVLGANARITVDDTGTGDIRFAINQRYVSADETSVAASSDVAIISVNGTHEPLVGAEVLGDDLLVDGVVAVPASTVGTDGDPLAVSADYLPSVLTPKPTAPDAPTGVTVESLQEVYGNPTGVKDGLLVVSWDAANGNGALVTGYEVTDSVSGETCSQTAPSLPDTTVELTCTIFGLGHNTEPQVTVTATNDFGTSPPSAVVAAQQVDLSGFIQSREWEPTDEPQNVAVGTSYVDGLEVTWDPPNPAPRRMPATSFIVEAEQDVTGTVFSCTARWDETSCVLPLPPGTAPLPSYHIDVWAEYADSPTTTTRGVKAQFGDHVYLAGIDPAPSKVAAVAPPRVPSPILDLQTSTGIALDVSIDGYISVPQGRIAIAAATPISVDVSLSGGVLAGELWVSPTNAPAALEVVFDNPVAQKRVRIQSTSSGSASATADAIVQVNRSGSLAINSWVVQ